MIVKNKNRSERRLFLQGGRLDILFEEATDEANERKEIKFGRGLELLKECPCGCGLENDVCPDRTVIVKRLNDEIPF